MYIPYIAHNTQRSTCIYSERSEVSTRALVALAWFPKFLKSCCWVHVFYEFIRFQYIMSSPKFPQNSGQAERSVLTVKDLLKKSSDPNITLLSYRAILLSWCDLNWAWEGDWEHPSLKQRRYLSLSGPISFWGLDEKYKGKQNLKGTLIAAINTPRHRSLDCLRRWSSTRKSCFTSWQTKVLCSGNAL